ncbi:MAG: hypothetical protein GY720_15735 [bacterium]|nr:hypothetical protein [bacterium]
MELRAVLATDSGRYALWDRAHFPGIVDYDTWEREPLEDVDVERHIASGHLVPINIRSDGAFAFTLRLDQTGSPAVSFEERRRVLVESEPYRFVTNGNADLSGLEHIADSVRSDGPVATMPIAAGVYEVRICLMDYDDIATRTNDHPDFIVLIGRPSGAGQRLSVDSFGD